MTTLLLRALSAFGETLCELAPVMLFPLSIGSLLASAVRCRQEHGFLQRWMIITVFGMFGSTIGSFMGAASTDEKVVSTLLPAIITLVSGYILFLSKKDLPSGLLRVLPSAILLMLLSVLFSAFYMKAFYNPLPAIDQVVP